MVVELGCKCPSSACLPRTPRAACSYGIYEGEQQPPDFAELTSGEAELVPLPTPEESYRSINAATCQCKAVTNAAVANLVELERYWAQVIIECDTKNVRENYCLDRDLLSLHAASLRNDAAAAALNAFYQLAGIEAQEHYLQLAIAEAEKTLERLEGLEKQGAESPEGVDRAAVFQKLSDLKERTVQLEFARIQLNGQLQKLVGCPLDEYSFFWPEMEWKPDLSEPDVQAELEHGLVNRQDLRGLELVLCNLEKETLPVARGVLKFADSTLGTVEPQEGLIHLLRCYHCNETELPVRCRQLAMLHEETEQTATAEIKSSVYKVKLHQEQVLLAKETVEELRRQLLKMTETRDVRNVPIFRISNLRGQVYEAETNLIEKIVSLKLAEVELRQAQGMLTEECGFAPELCLEGCCDGACMRCSDKSCRRCKAGRR